MNAAASRGLADDRRATHGLADREYRAQDPDTACVCLDNAEQVLADHTAALESDKQDLVVLQTGWRYVAEEGAAGRLDAERTKVNRIRHDLAAYIARAAAARLLRDTMATARDEARHAHVRPLQEKIESLGRPVFAPTLAVDLSDDLRIASRVLHGRRVDSASLSTGAREQVSVISRLACASLVSTSAAFR